MKATVTHLGWVDSDSVTLESCENGLDYLAYMLREDLEEGRDTSSSELQETREIAIELLTQAAKCLGELWTQSPAGEVVPVSRFVRLLRAVARTSRPSASRTELADALQTAADLIRSARRDMEVAGPVLTR